MNRPFWLSFAVMFFPDQADDQRDQEHRNPDDSGRKPVMRAERTEVLKGQIVPILPGQGPGIPLDNQAEGEDESQQRAEKDEDRSGFPAFHGCCP